jgi:hypothetical protein
MDVSKMTRQEIEALMRLLAECERRELALLLLERREAERQGRVHYPTPPAACWALLCMGPISDYKY